ncbi:tetratricopeptide repeat protein [bacterium SCSIO 12741]|nr:tetratricopeptide repeat protein [bacterium SCSIO 12741]
MSGKEHYEKGMTLYREGKLQEALEALSQALNEEPENAYWLSDRGVCFFHQKKFKEALEDMNRAQKLQPNNPYRYSSRAYIRDVMGDTQGAVEDYQKAVHLDPEDAIAHNNLGMLLEKLGRKQEAEKSIKRADKLAGAQEYREKMMSKLKEQGAPEPEAPAGSLMGEMAKVFLTRKGMKEFLQFIRNGFKLRE